LITDVQGFNIPYTPGDLSLNELSILSNNNEVYREINLTRYLSDEIKELRSLFKSFPISFQIVIDFYEELIQLLRYYNETNNNTDNGTLEKIIEYLQMVRNSTLHPVYQPPLTDIELDNEKIKNIAVTFLQSQEVNFNYIIYI